MKTKKKYWPQLHVQIILRNQLQIILIMTSQQSWHSVKISFSPSMVRKRIYKISVSLTIENSQISQNSFPIDPHHRHFVCIIWIALQLPVFILDYFKRIVCQLSQLFSDWSSSSSFCLHHLNRFAFVCIIRNFLSSFWNTLSGLFVNSLNIHQWWIIFNKRVHVNNGWIPK